MTSDRHLTRCQHRCAWSSSNSWLKVNGLFRLVTGTATKPTVSSEPKAGEEDALEAWETKQEKAAGMIFLMVEQDQEVHFNGEKDDPVKMWKALEDAHKQKRPGTRFNAYDSLFSIRKAEEETLQTLVARVNNSMLEIKQLRSPNFTLDKLDDELVIMTSIRALGEEFSNLTSNLLLQPSLDKQSLISAFVTEDINRRHHANPTEPSALAMASSAP